MESEHHVKPLLLVLYKLNQRYKMQDGKKIETMIPPVSPHASLSRNFPKAFSEGLDRFAAQKRDSLDVNLYVHIPFCPSKCHYCAWVSAIPVGQLVKSQSIYEPYVSAVIKQIGLVLGQLRSKAGEKQLMIQNIYIGGGTPTVLDARDLVQILKALREHFDSFSADGTSTIEGSPDTVDFEKLRILRKGGFDRLSLGLQSFDDELLKKMGRKAKSSMAATALAAARKAGFKDVNVDIMFGLPGETKKSWEETVEKTLEIGPDHISAYRYRFVQGTTAASKLSSGIFERENAIETLRRYEWARRQFVNAGFEEYMLGLFAKRNQKCTMDESYFNLSQDWLGFGLGAHSLLGKKGWTNTTEMSAFLVDPLEARSHDETQVLASAEIFFINMLNSEKGIVFRAFRDRLGISFEKACESNLRLDLLRQKLQREGALKKSPGGLAWVNSAAKAEWMAKLGI